ncbi:LysR family transcriptional regulator [Pseudomonas fluorescens]|uniref:LysR substrate-binding domain-containing protein n=1 Tax=Pseudomonas fluorescens TaxID=294 RepID=UPI001903E2AF|nr:LysR substrate-binding domain-containing protein [Pseudomonas fluorescens]MBD8094587.1 LysR family transcriptional regulator [Pseudomonas fluorescens]MBD8720502.1 LysR family transcriptional regulator [Pseudomonas fluorescens]
MNPRTLNPSMSSLLAFEASARHGSFTRAAEELSLSQSAVSRQVQALEELLGVELFDRVGRHITLTEVGRIYTLEIAGSLARIRDATMQTLAYRSGGGSLHLGVLPAFGTKWLLPRMSDFYAKHPEILVHIHSRASTVDFLTTGLDAAICVGDGLWPHVVSHKLFDEELVPVVGGCNIAAQEYKSAEDLRTTRLLQVAPRPNLWIEWFKMQNCQPGRLQLGPQFELTTHLIQAVSSGIGVGLLPRFLVRDELANKTLRIPFDSMSPTGSAYYLLVPPHKCNHRPVSVFINWLVCQF